MVTGTTTKRRLLAWLVAAGLLLAQLAALAHEFDHALHKHEAPCALHIYSDHLGKTLASHADVVLPAITREVPFAPDTASAPRPRIVDYRVRAPPVSS